MSTSRRRGRRKRALLLIESADAVREGLRVALLSEHYGVVAVASLANARSALSSVRFDAIVLDVVLGAERGEELLDELAQSPSAPAVVIVSGSVEARKTAKHYGVVCVEKPFDLDVLLAAIRTAIDKEMRPDVGR